MINIARAAAPIVLASSKSERRYRDSEVVAALYSMQHEKCCYCEKYIPVSGTGRQVEHFRPQSSYPELRNEWSNLLLACETCNWTKRDKFPTTSRGTAVLLDPTDQGEDPEDHIDFAIDSKSHLGGGASTLGMALPRNRSKRGAESIKTIGLNKGYLVKHRRDTVGYLDSKYLQLREAVVHPQDGKLDKETIASLLKDLRNCKSPKKSFAGVARYYWRRKNLAAY